MKNKLCVACLVFIAGNFAYQFGFGLYDWSEAIERSYFQLALFLYVMFMLRNKKIIDKDYI